MISRALLPAAGLVLLPGLVLAGCSEPEVRPDPVVVPQADVEAAVVAEYESTAGEEPDDVTCVKGVVGTVGDRAQCTLVVDGDETPVVVTVSGTDGDTVDDVELDVDIEGAVIE